MAATNPADAGLDHPTVVPTNYVPETPVDENPTNETHTDETHTDKIGTDDERMAGDKRGTRGAPRCPACGRPLTDH